MSEVFEEREKGYEAKFKLDQEQLFKAKSRRNKLLGLWLAEKFGMTKSEAEAYAKELVVAELDKPAGDVLAKVMSEIEARGVGMTEEEVQGEMDRLYAIALEQVANE